MVTMHSPLLFSREVRVHFHNRLPRAVKEGLRAIAEKENKSMSWVIEEVIIDYFSLRRPRYINRKNKNRNK